MQDKEREGGKAPLIVVTHITKEQNIKKAVADINATGLAKVDAVIRVIS